LPAAGQRAVREELELLRIDASILMHTPQTASLVHHHKYRNFWYDRSGGERQFAAGAGSQSGLLVVAECSYLHHCLSGKRGIAKRSPLRQKGKGAMTDFALPVSMEPAKKRPNLDKGFNPLTMILFGGILAGGLLFVAYSLYVDIDAAGTKVTSYVPFLLLFVALPFLLSVVAGSFAAVILGSYGIAQLIASAL
jgi:hypothetical protein